jgi:hypothetical protein
MVLAEPVHSRFERRVARRAAAGVAGRVAPTSFRNGRFGVGAFHNVLGVRRVVLWANGHSSLAE